MIMGAYALLLKNPKATRADIVKDLDSHLCRCGAHVRIVQAVESAATQAMKGARDDAANRDFDATRNWSWTARRLSRSTAATSSS